MNMNTPPSSPVLTGPTIVLRQEISGAAPAHVAIIFIKANALPNPTSEHEREHVMSGVQAWSEPLERGHEIAVKTFSDDQKGEAQSQQLLGLLEQVVGFINDKTKDATYDAGVPGFVVSLKNGGDVLDTTDRQLPSREQLRATASKNIMANMTALSLQMTRQGVHEAGSALAFIAHMAPAGLDGLRAIVGRLSSGSLGELSVDDAALIADIQAALPDLPPEPSPPKP